MFYENIITKCRKDKEDEFASTLDYMDKTSVRETRVRRRECRSPSIGRNLADHKLNMTSVPGKQT